MNPKNRFFNPYILFVVVLILSTGSAQLFSSTEKHDKYYIARVESFLVNSQFKDAKIAFENVNKKTAQKSGISRIINKINLILQTNNHTKNREKIYNLGEELIHQGKFNLAKLYFTQLANIHPELLFDTERYLALIQSKITDKKKRVKNSFANYSSEQLKSLTNSINNKVSPPSIINWTCKGSLKESVKTRFTLDRVYVDDCIMVQWKQNRVLLKAEQWRNEKYEESITFASELQYPPAFLQCFILFNERLIGILKFNAINGKILKKDTNVFQKKKDNIQKKKDNKFRKPGPQKIH